MPSVVDVKRARRLDREAIVAVVAMVPEAIVVIVAVIVVPAATIVTTVALPAATAVPTAAPTQGPETVALVVLVPIAQRIATVNAARVPAHLVTASTVPRPALLALPPRLPLVVPATPALSKSVAPTKVSRSGPVASTSGMRPSAGVAAPRRCWRLASPSNSRRPAVGS